MDSVVENSHFQIDGQTYYFWRETGNRLRIISELVSYGRRNLLIINIIYE